MKTYVYSRMEVVYYVVGVAGEGTRADAFADTLAGDRPRAFKHYEHDKPFRAMNDRRIMYVERVGSSAPGAAYIGKELSRRAQARAEQVMAQHGHADMEITKRKRKTK